ncbi:hypothetical protein [Sphingobium sp. Cam5-1]|uniref:hypothetical protein n=1 Tax=Sphingobium sp. Cam5-1 TaxID=2789327 RepID=UPI0018AD1E30|nr:hypothetical protein [Sphingobium sp. Cam5-1]QPI71989.1 hypothetical protein IZV00_08655 [Sphingobium sp. Cam5-1]
MSDQNFVQSIYLREPCDKLVMKMYGNAHVLEQALICSAGSKIKIDGLFGRFFASHWFNETNIDRVFFCFRFRGDIAISIIAQDMVTGREWIVTQYACQADDEREIALPIDLQECAQASLYAQFSCNLPSSVHDPRWTSDAPPLRSCSLALVAIVSEAPEGVLHPVEALARRIAAADRSAVIDIHIIDLTVDQSCAEAVAQISSICDLPPIRVDPFAPGQGVLQRALAVVACGRATHILILSGEASIEPSFFDRVRYILCHAREDIRLSATYLDRHSLRIPVMVGPGFARSPIDANACQRPDSDGWGAIALPREDICRHGLPFPLHDDAREYRQRLMDGGRKMLVWPDVAVSGRPRLQTSPPWAAFYEARDALFLRVWQRRSRTATALELSGKLLTHLIHYDYLRANLMLKGMAAYRAGAPALLAWSGKDHAELVAGAAPRYRCEGQRFPPLRTRRLSPRASGRCAWKMIRALMSDLFLPGLKPLIRRGFVRAENLTPYFEPRPKLILIRHAATRRLEERQYDWKRCWSLVAGFVCLMVRLALRRRTEFHLNSMASFDFWNVHSDAQRQPNP